MFEGLREKAGHLDELIWRLGDALVAKHSIEETSCIAQTLPDAAHVMGRVCCDAADGKLNAQSLLLQGTQDVSGGR